MGTFNKAIYSAMGTDFNGDGRDDILWRHDNGTLTNWLGTPSGGFVENYYELSAQVSTDLTVWATGDFNGDGLDDILWRNDDGTFTDWLWDHWEASYYSGALSRVVPVDWRLAGIGDFDGDGRDDILWRNDNGTLTNWLGTASGGFTENYGALSRQVPIAWNVAATGDFNGDGRDDILWRHANGTLTDWLGTPDGGMIENYGALSVQVPIDWRVVGTGDFNGDGRDDILWRHENGTLTDWLGTASGGFVENYGALSQQVATDWNVEDTGDFNGDGRDDILWRNDNGTLTDWLGTASGGFIGNDAAINRAVPIEWVVQPHPSHIDSGWWDY